MPLRQQSATVLFSVSEIPFLALSKPKGTLPPSITSISESPTSMPMTCARS